MSREEYGDTLWHRSRTNYADARNYDARPETALDSIISETTRGLGCCRG
jgi:hypothetical protein